MVVKSRNSRGWASVYLLVKRSDKNCMTIMGENSYGAQVIGQEKPLENLPAGILQINQF
jgi:hypothetical protein